MDYLGLFLLAVTILDVFALAVVASSAGICLCAWMIRPKKRNRRDGSTRRWPVIGLFLALVPHPARAQKIDYNRDIRPILSDNCYTCHGPDKTRRRAGLRLDQHASALAELRSGGFALVPGKRSESELWNRITAEEAIDLMPPRRTGKKLSAAQIAVLGKWIDQGARWDEHWAYVVPKRPGLPKVADPNWPRNAIDYFVLARLEKAGLRPAPEADRATLLRRVSFDLIGLPPTPAELDAFANDQAPNAYEKVVDRLLASPHYGERMAQQWLDLARYADTNGYRLDNHRDLWKWRAWVINAFNRNQPFDAFTIEQLAGDLLPRATLEQKIATGFHRNTMVNFGNGSDPKEYLHKAVSDRAATTAAVWLGTTLACAQCHDHKYDPFTQKDYYRLYAFFNNVPEKGVDGEKANPVPSLALPTPAQARQLAQLRSQLARVEARIQVYSKTQIEFEPLHREYKRLKKAAEHLAARIPSSMVMEELPEPRVTHVLLRGDYLSAGEVVTAGVPASLPPLPRGAPANRLGLARWLTGPRHPLTSRVTVNRYWQRYFGTGIVKTSDDFGSQGEVPSHPELLDWLATEFVARQWDVKAMQKLIVLSATYRQSSHTRKDLQEKDPHNRFLARGPRFRLDAETIRDNALAVSGLLDRRIGGPSVRPYQPAGLWEQVAVGGNYSSQTYVQSKGPDLYRRGLYTYVKRSMPHPLLATFDAPNRETCTVSRPLTNTPLQALVLWNDPTFVEAARVLAQRVLQQAGPACRAGLVRLGKSDLPQEDLDSAGRLRFAFRLCTSRAPAARELRILGRVLDGQLRNYHQHRQAARDLVSVGEAPRPTTVDVADLAAWTAVSSLLLNLDETITRR